MCNRVDYKVTNHGLILILESLNNHFKASCYYEIYKFFHLIILSSLCSTFENILYFVENIL
jgi:hypothetical protein